MSATTDKDRYADLKLSLQLVCQKCRRSGLVPWEQLDRIVLCRSCSTWYRIARGGLEEVAPPQANRVSVQVRSSSSEWSGHEAIIPAHAPTTVKRWRVGLMAFVTQGRSRWAAACALVLSCLGSMALAARGSAPPAPLELPSSLDERAVVCTLAIARRDQQVLVRLTDPAQHRRLRSWLAHECPLEAQPADNGSTLEASVVSSIAGGDHRAELRVRVAAAQREAAVLSERWIELDGTWYFQPPMTPRATVQRTALPAAKAARRSR